jgi:DNA (cytosine-5)-methyltransferase 1
MRYGSVCSGVEAATVAWHPLGWQPVWFSEIDEFASKVLAHHYPNTPNYGDMATYKEWPDDPIDLLVGGTPCQSFSISGLRKGLDDPRGNLMLTYLAIAARYKPRWVAWENVPGVLSSNGGRDFGTLLRALGELGYGFAYRVLDAQYFGVAQRRRRVFVVGCLGDWRCAAAVLFERESMSGNPAPIREKKEIASDCVQGRIASGKPVFGTLMANAGTKLWLGNQEAFSGDYHILQKGFARRLMPRECERLQGFPEDYTLIQYKNKPSPDGLRYKAMGNSMAVPVMRWIGSRIEEVSKW